MREIKFRGRDGDDWYYGSLFVNEYGHTAISAPKSFWMKPVNADTVGQFTGLHDANGREIYEGDVIKLDNEVYIVSWAKYSACWFVDLKNFGPFLFTQYHAGKSIVIGNIHDNPDLLERGGN